MNIELAKARPTYPWETKWGIYLTILSLSLVIYQLGRLSGNIFMLEEAKFWSAFQNSLMQSFSYGVYFGSSSVTGEMIVIGLWSYILHWAFGVSFGRSKKIVILWWTVLLLMSLFNLIALF